MNPENEKPKAHPENGRNPGLFPVPETAQQRAGKYLASIGVTAALTIPGFLLRQALDTSTIAMFYLLGVVGIAFWWGRGPALTASLLSALALDYFITVPYYSFAVGSPQAWVTLFVMLVESLVISTLAAQSRAGEYHRIAAEAEKSRNSLLSAVSHDLRTPLTAIKGAAGSLMGNPAALSPEERFQLSSVIYDEAERMNRLIQNLLDMTRLQAGPPQLRKEWHSMEELVGTASSRLKARLASRPFELALGPGLPLLFVDGLLVEQLLLNLLENALNHTPEKTPLHLSVRKAGEFLEVEVSDEGPGLKPGEEKLIFEKFTRGYHGGKGGAGLGLSICRAIAQAHGGTIGAANRPGGGACFTARLPIGGPAPAVSED